MFLVYFPFHRYIGLLLGSSGELPRNKLHALAQ